MEVDQRTEKRTRNRVKAEEGRGRRRKSTVLLKPHKLLAHKHEAFASSTAVIKNMVKTSEVDKMLRKA